ncbi:DNA polymerase subunit gamma-1, mitochondrial [Bombus pascuorum]|uniref:DNA polymerase subunit gamma-1, mitochondrial n=1 Tax=Bombus pascuorum TaxID=65598 RepID=UPI00298E3397|nr:DNA polymerase subunit gamma-1, mitochondrial [Bombus pascuorum]
MSRVNIVMKLRKIVRSKLIMKRHIINICNRHKSNTINHSVIVSEGKQFRKRIINIKKCGPLLTLPENISTCNQKRENDVNKGYIAKDSVVLPNKSQVSVEYKDLSDIPKNFEQSLYPLICSAKSNYKDSLIEHKDIRTLENENNQKQTYNERTNDSDVRINEINMQMLSKSLYEQIFKNFSKQEKIPEEEIEAIKNNLRSYGINTEDASRLPDVNIKIPPLEGNNIEEHFYNIANTQIKPYIKLIKNIMKDIPPMPNQWLLNEGWTRYSVDGIQKVDYPLEDAIIFDVEVCMKEGPLPTLATAVTNEAWYGWVSKSLIDGSSRNFEGKQFTIDELIPMESTSIENGKKLTSFHKKPKLIVGHNVSYDRSKIKEQYWLKHTGLRFIDTMSLHICVTGINSYQRAILNSKKDTDEKLNLQIQTSLNSLTEIHKFYCGSEINKESRDTFVNGTLVNIKEDFNSLMSYCANDVVATHNVLRQLFPIFEERFPHPVTLAGMLEIGTAYLPINSNWQKYLNESETTFEDLNYETKVILAKRANAVCELMHNEKYKEDLWMWNEDWSTQTLKVKAQYSKTKIKEICKAREAKEKKKTETQSYLTDDEDEEEDPLEKEFGYVMETRKFLPSRLPHMPGYPAWYRKLCPKVKDENWSPGPQDISTSKRIVPMLLNLTWECYPLHYVKDKGWGILVPHTNNLDIKTKVPLRQLLAHCSFSKMKGLVDETIYTMSTINKEVQNDLHKTEFWRTKREKPISELYNLYKGSAFWCNVDIDNCCYFLKLPHKDGKGNNVGNPLGKDFLNKFSENVLASSDASAVEILKIAKMVSYWRNNRDRIMSQFAVWFENSYLPHSVRSSKKSMRYGAILPTVVVCGTLTRRAVEPTWMTASNAHPERIGSELRGMIQAPPGYYIVGADVDSQELWISSMIGDAYYKKIHGATPFGWMTLIGTKSNETDMHSVTAKAVGISRNHAKIINYARIYGAGQKFAETLLKQFNPCMTDNEAASKSRKMFTMTKGKKIYILKPEYIGEFEDKDYSLYEAYRISKLYGKSLLEIFKKSKWVGGSESAMFNSLEEIAENPHPVTPFLNSRLTAALESSTNNEKYLPTKVNWVVQSGAVDFLHLMLVSMKWLMKDNIRFCLSFHDEVRYLVPSRYKYNAALAMHITNLLTRSFCASRLGMYDLPMSVAFFSSVEVDTVLRKEPENDCITPSNPYGLKNGYEIPPGESLDVWSAIDKSKGSLGSWHDVKQRTIAPNKKYKSREIKPKTNEA